MIEIYPGDAVLIDELFDHSKIETLGQGVIELIEGHSFDLDQPNKKRNFTPLKRAGTPFSRMDDSWWDALQSLRDETHAALVPPATDQLGRDGPCSFIITKRASFAWHPDAVPDFRILTNTSTEATTVDVAKEWKLKKTRPDLLAENPTNFETFTIQPGQSYVLNNLVTELSPLRYGRPHRTPAGDTRLMLRQIFSPLVVGRAHWSGTHVEAGGMTIRLKADESKELQRVTSSAVPLEFVD